MIVAVTGGRDYANQPKVSHALNEINLKSPIALIVTGGCTGADHLAVRWARSIGIDYCQWPANFDYYGKGGGPRRNQKMLHYMKPKLLVAFPGGSGTANCREVAFDLGIEVVVIE